VARLLAAQLRHATGISDETEVRFPIVEDLIELRPSADATTTYDDALLEWARAFPAEHSWKVRRE
jgi:hypothetical protein